MIESLRKFADVSLKEPIGMSIMFAVGISLAALIRPNALPFWERLALGEVTCWLFVGLLVAAFAIRDNK